MPGSEQGGFVSLGGLLPLLLSQIPFWVVCIRLASRKGKATWVYATFGWIPLINISLMAFLIGHTDKAVFDKLDAIALASAGAGQPTGTGAT